MKRILAVPFILLLLLWCNCAHVSRQTKSLQQITIMHEGRSRTCLLHIPANAAARSHPLLIVFHGNEATPGAMVKLTKYRFNELADSSGCLVAYPAGLGHCWNDFRGDPKCYAYSEHSDDVKFVSSLIDKLAADYSIDKNRVFAAGFSNGGFMSYRLACELPGKIRGIAAVAATNTYDQAARCASKLSIPVMIINGTGDPLVPYNGGEIKLQGVVRGRVISTDDTVRFWARFDNCPGNPVIEDLPDSDPADHTKIRKISYGPCGRGTRVVLYSVVGGGHAWPGGMPMFTSFMGYTSRDINACDLIWDFFGLGR